MNSTSISQFEREKPKKTYEAIKHLRCYLEAAIDYDRNEVPVQDITEYLDKIEEHFLAGE